jgi:hypothetical protein
MRDMLPRHLESELETATVALNRWSYADSVGLPVEPNGYAPPTARLARLYERLLDEVDTGLRYFAVEQWAASRQAPLEQHLIEAKDRLLRVPGLVSSSGDLTWRNWKAFEREAKDTAVLREAFEELVDRSADLVPMLDQRLAAERADFGAYGLTPVHTFAWREGLEASALAAMLRHVGHAAREPFTVALEAICQAVYGRRAGPAELRALYLNRMYEPLARLFSADDALSSTRRAFARLGFDLSHIPVDIEDRPRKYAGAFCFPVAIPSDVRVSVRMASAHHLVDMLYHEFGHAIHFSRIRADLSFVDRYWVHAGVHETFSTLFERLLDEPEFLGQQFALGDDAIDALLNFGNFKLLVTCTWLCAVALTAVEAWLEGLSWLQVEERYATHIAEFTGVPMPPGFARLDTFASTVSVYPAGYVIALLRALSWSDELRQAAGPAWWYVQAAQTKIRAHMREGGAVAFPEAWSDPANLVSRLRLLRSS